VGAGPTGALLAIFLRRRGLTPEVFERRADPRGRPSESGRSINLALADRGIQALKMAGVYDAIEPYLVPMRGRRVHQVDGSVALALYGRRPSEAIYSISRHLLNQTLLDVAEREHGVRFHFEHRLTGIDVDLGTAELHDERGNGAVSVAMPLLATDGAGSFARRRLAGLGLIEVTDADTAHGYKELSIPAGVDGAYRMDHDALHIWPRGNFMLIALPNTDGSFTATLFLADRGPISFESLNSPAVIDEFLREQFPDAYALMPDCVAEFEKNPTGPVSTVYAKPWSAAGKVALIGDAAHAIVPFHGQGMNCCFEDCVAFDDCVGRHDTWEAVFADFYARRKPQTDAIAAMALENYLEMRERVADPTFRLQQTLALELERRHPRQFIPRYSMVMFHHEIPYDIARTRGMVQSQLLADLTAAATTLQDVDYARAARDIDSSLPPLKLEPAVVG